MSATTPNLYLNPTLEQMDKTHQESKYYAMATNIAPETSAKNHTLATVSVSGGEKGASYSCTANLSITIDGTMKDKLTANDAFIKLTGSRTTGLNDTDSSTYNLEEDTALKTIIDSSSTYENIEIGFSLKEGEETNTATIKGDVWLVNTTSEQSGTNAGTEGANDISNKDLTVTVTVNNLECNVVTEP